MAGARLWQDVYSEMESLQLLHAVCPRANAQVHLLVDGISSQKEHDRAVALQRMANAGAPLALPVSYVCNGKQHRWFAFHT